MITKNKISRALVLILAAAFILRMSLILAFRTYAHPVGWEYEAIANRLLAGHGYSIEFLHTTYWSFNTPLYGFLCAGIYAITNHSYFPILIIQSFFTIALALLVFKIAKMFFSDGAGLLAAALVAFHPGFIYYDVFNLLPLSIDSFLIAAVTLVFLKHKNKLTLTSMSLIGALIGIATLSRGISGALLLLVLIYIFLFAKNLDLKKRISMALCVVIASVIILAPWLIRNYFIHKQFVFISSTSSENFWRGNNMRATGTSYDENKTTILELWPQEFKERVFSLTEMQQKKFFEDEALRFISARPLAAMKLYVKKVFYFWWFSPQSGIIYPNQYLTIYKFFYTILLSFFVPSVGFAVISSKGLIRESYLILLSVPLTICLAQSVFYVEGRHRWLVEPLMMVFVAYGLLRLWQVIVERPLVKL